MRVKINNFNFNFNQDGKREDPEDQVANDQGEDEQARAIRTIEELILRANLDPVILYLFISCTLTLESRCRLVVGGALFSRALPNH